MTPSIFLGLQSDPNENIKVELGVFKFVLTITERNNAILPKKGVRSFHFEYSLLLNLACGDSETCRWLHMHLRKNVQLRTEKLVDARKRGLTRRAKAMNLRHRGVVTSEVV